MKRNYLIFLACFNLLMLFIKIQTYGQEVEHNYKVGPQQTDCDSLRLDAIDQETSIELIKAAKFRYQQSFKLTRREGFKGGEYFSCDNQQGYLMIKYHDRIFWYKSVPLDFWKEMISSSDPEGYYLKGRQKLEEL